MKILVCIKQVPDMESKFKVAASGKWYDTADLAWRMNEYDEYAVEQAVQVKEQVGDADLTVLCIGGERVKETMKKALAMGCDRGVHVADDKAAEKEPFEIAGIIAEFARDKQFDLIFTGMQSQDRGSAQVGVLTAEMLGIPSISTIVQFAYADGRIETRRELEGGVKSIVKAAAPALVTCQLGLNTPRYPTLPNIMKAKKKELLSLPVADLLKVDARQETGKMYFPVKKGGGLVLEGEIGQLVDQLIQILKEKTGVLA
ncbi:electron transfer flavoprotein subunit beta/FixA family protein [Desulfoprunum benzoelyticum]|uniref:Electron transfer flavoprotein subunit beta n=1 Tax=Desulfoprunum benzoelyticum TaxID=1506996 RepID=A0A840UZT9_9BACT|nr:electron transfer flavoprotein subunit beta/FixA family protein [Desulfoprunum benzoelyticum]MBB5347070.1 electron transfer flavoprotein beta subunit [Desulfoprunum benzoelyticum]MBM9529764.1 electron transfer flavoprotein subunit beta/FixA family protein [Desulfoprunum benzoelyticum]